LKKITTNNNNNNKVSVVGNDADDKNLIKISSSSMMVLEFCTYNKSFHLIKNKQTNTIPMLVINTQ